MNKLFSIQMIAVAANALIDWDGFDYHYNSMGWHSWPAHSKYERLMGELEQTKETIDYHYAEMTTLFSQKSNKTTCSSGEELPGDRKKLIHTKGIVGGVKLVHDPNVHDANPYTGLFQ